MSKHTPGPWVVSTQDSEKIDRRFLIKEQGFGGNLAAVFDVARHEAEANARLIAAAPEMLEALKAIRAVTCDPDGNVSIDGSDADREEIAKALAVIAKAGGAE